MVPPGGARRLGLLVALTTACSAGPAGTDGGSSATDAAPADAGAAPADAAPPAPEIYPEGRTHSPITEYVAAHLRAIAAGQVRDGARFAKVGDSITVDSNFLHCFAGGTIDWAGRDLLQPVRDHFAGSSPEPFDRDSLAAGVGWTAREPLIHEPGLADELSAMDPRFAVVMFGTNDVGWHDVDWFGGNLLDLTDTLIAAGVVPIVSTIPPRDDDSEADAEVPRYNAIARGVAQARQIPLIDFHRELAVLPDHGLWGDGIHPDVFSGGGCVFTADGLQHGQNVRNLITLEALGRAKAAVVDGAAALDPPQASVVGSGSPGDPIVIGGLPFADLRDTALSPHRAVDSYPGCDADPDESGPELTYRLELAAPATIRAMVVDRGEVDIDIHLMSGPSGADCLVRAHQVLVASLAPGTYTFNLDTYVDGGVERAGEYLFVVTVDPS